MATFLSKSDSPYLAASAALRSEHERLAANNRMLRHSVAAMSAALVLALALSLYRAREPNAVPYVVEVDKAQ